MFAERLFLARVLVCSILTVLSLSTAVCADPPRDAPAEPPYSDPTVSVPIDITGTGPKRSDVFTLQKGARLYYDMTADSDVGGILAVYVVKDGESLETTGGLPDVEVTHPGRDVTRLVNRPGDYYLDVTAANCTWRAWIVQPAMRAEPEAPLTPEVGSAPAPKPAPAKVRGPLEEKRFHERAFLSVTDVILGEMSTAEDSASTGVSLVGERRRLAGEAFLKRSETQFADCLRELQIAGPPAECAGIQSALIGSCVHFKHGIEMMLAELRSPNRKKLTAAAAEYARGASGLKRAGQLVDHIRAMAGRESGAP